MFSPDAASGEVSDPQQLNRHKDEALLASVGFRLPFRKKKTAPCLHRPPLIHSHPLTSAPSSPGAPSASSSVSPAARTHSSRLPFSSFRAAAPCFACRAQGRTLCCSLLCQHAASACRAAAGSDRWKTKQRPPQSAVRRMIAAMGRSRS